MIPCLLLRRRGLYKTVRFRDPRYVGDPINAVRIFNDKGVDELIVLGIDCARSRSEPDFEMLSDIAGEAFVPACYGGGVKSLEDFHKLFRLGMEKVAVNTSAVENLSLVTAAAERFGSQSVVVSIDVKRTLFGKYSVYTAGGSVKSAHHPLTLAKQAQDAGAGEILVSSIDRDGTMQGLDLDLVKSVTAAVSVPVIAAGGVGSLVDVREGIQRAGASGVAIGSLFVFTGKHKAVLITYPSQEEIERTFARV